MQDFLDREAVKDLACRYARGVDRRDAGLLASVFTTDGILQSHANRHGPGGADIASRIIARHTAKYAATFHFIGNQTVEISGGLARGETYCVALHWYVRDSVHYERIVYIRYADTAIRANGEWRFKERIVNVDRAHTYDVRPDERTLPPVFR